LVLAPVLSIAVISVVVGLVASSRANRERVAQMERERQTREVALRNESQAREEAILSESRAREVAILSESHAREVGATNYCLDGCWRFSFGYLYVYSSND
jgi:hypothetical protein